MLHHESLVRHFEKIGATLRVRPWIGGRRRIDPAVTPPTFNLDIAIDKGREYFDLRVGRDAPTFHVLQANSAARHLLLYAVNGRANARDGGERFLCGHDERHWFVATIADRVTTVTDAKRSLLPAALKDAGLTPDDLARRHTGTFKRQGEWFFLPTDKTFDGVPIHRGERLMRARGGKPHIAAELVRFGGQQVVLYAGEEYSLDGWAGMCAANPSLAHKGRRMAKNPEFYVRGPVRHPDHATLILPTWHLVLPNAEGGSVNMSYYD